MKVFRDYAVLALFGIGFAVVVVLVGRAANDWLEYDYKKALSYTRVVATPNGSGSGAYIETSQGVRFLTAAHVCWLFGSIFVGDGQEEMEVVKISQEKGLCLAKPKSASGGIKLAKAYGGDFDNWYTAGFPKGHYFASTGTGVLLEGLLHTDIVVDLGSSGSPIVNKAGYLVGMVFAMSYVHGGSTAKPIETIREFLEEK